MLHVHMEHKVTQKTWLGATTAGISAAKEQIWSEYSGDSIS